MSEFNENDIIWFPRVNINNNERINVDFFKGRVCKTYKYDIKIGGRVIDLYDNDEKFLIGINWIYASKKEAIHAMIERLQELEDD